MEIQVTFQLFGAEKRLHIARSIAEALRVSRQACTPESNVLEIAIALPSGQVYTVRDVFRLTDVLPDGSIEVLDPRNNPLHDEVQRYLSQPSGDSHFFNSQITARLSKTYSYARSEPKNIRFVAHALGPQAVEMGAGSGYWSWLLSKLDIEMIAYDIAPRSRAIVVPETLPGWSRQEGYRFPRNGFWHPVLSGTPERLAQHGDRSLLLCYPPQHHPLAFECLRAWSGRRLVVIGHCGLVGSLDFFHELDTHWEQVGALHSADWITPTSITIYQR
jgi:hypothetical protein